MNAAVAMSLLMTISIMLLLAYAWSRPAIANEYGKHDPSVLPLAAATVAAAAHFIWVILFVYAPPISKGQHSRLYLLLFLVGALPSLLATATGLVVKSQRSRLAALSGAVLCMLWLLAGIASMPVS